MDISKEIEECLIKLRKIQDDDDPEMAHTHADECITRFLSNIGFSDIVYEYDQIDKWYA